MGYLGTGAIGAGPSGEFPVEKKLVLHAGVDLEVALVELVAMDIHRRNLIREWRR